MNIRKKTYAYYGIDEDEKERLLEMCQNLNDELSELLLSCAKEACRSNKLGSQIAMSLIYDMGFYKLRNYMEIPLKKADDFYGYRRRTLWLFKTRLEEQTRGNLPENSLKGGGEVIGYGKK